MAEFKFAAQPQSESCRLINYESYKVIPGIVNDTFFLSVQGTKPCINMEVRLSPLVYVTCPEYWGIEIVGCLPGGICLPAIGRYDEVIPLAGVTGSKGIELIGASRRETIKVSGGCQLAQPSDC